MSSAAAAGAPSSADDSVYRAVAAGGSLEEVRRAIERSPSSAAAVNQAGANGETPLHAAGRLRRGDLVCLLLQNGVEGAGRGDWWEAVCWCAQQNDLAALQRLFERGVSVDTVNHASGLTPLMLACCCAHVSNERRDCRNLTFEIFRRSSAETRRAVTNGGWSAADYFYFGQADLQPWHAALMCELLAAGAPMQPGIAARAVPMVAAHAARREAELAAFQSMAHDWRAHETFVGLSLDMGELREADQMVAARRARLEALERELGSESEGGSSGGESERESESEEGEATGSGGGGKE